MRRSGDALTSVNGDLPQAVMTFAHLRDPPRRGFATASEPRVRASRCGGRSVRDVARDVQRIRSTARRGIAGRNLHVRALHAGIVQVLSRDHLKSYGLFMTITELQDERTVKQAIVFGEAPMCDPQPLQTWFPFPERTAYSFNKSVGYRFLC